MSMSRTQIVTTAAGGSVLLLAGAFLFQMAGYPPCEMCLWQRWPHAAAFVIGIAFMVIPNRIFLWLGALAAATTGLIGIYHAGVEQKWWDGPSGCTGDASAITNMSAADLLSTEIADTIIMCDQIAWQMAGISMAGWNAIISLFLAGLWVTAARRPT